MADEVFGVKSFRGLAKQVDDLLLENDELKRKLTLAEEKADVAWGLSEVRTQLVEVKRDLARKPSCSTCPYYDADVVLSRAILSNWANGQKPETVPEKGGCRFDPAFTPHKRPDEWCGKHPYFEE